MKGSKTFYAATRWVRSRLRPGALILGYHRVAEVSEDPYDMVVSPAHFEAHLQVLRQIANPLSLQGLLQGLQDNTLPRRSVAVTFDDGYEDFASTVEPLLKRYEIPATLFVVSGSLGQDFWWDQLQSLVYLCESLPEELSAYAGPHDSRQAQLLSIYQHLLIMPQAQRSALLDTFDLRSAVRVLSDSALVDLNQSEWVEVASHSVSHPLMAKLSLEEQRYEIEQSKRELESLLGQPVHGFSYPNGSVAPESHGLVRAAGYDYACVSASGYLDRGSNRYKLPRLWVQDWTKNQFLRWSCLRL